MGGAEGGSEGLHGHPTEGWGPRSLEGWGQIRGEDKSQRRGLERPRKGKAPNLKLLVRGLLDLASQANYEGSIAFPRSPGSVPFGPAVV